MRTREGYLMVDHRASPGLSEDFARRAGYDPALVREGKVLEADILQCRHCPRPEMKKNPFRTRERGHCFKCNSYVCDFCALEMTKSDYIHRPFVKLIDDTMESAYRAETSGNLYLPLLTKGP